MSKKIPDINKKIRDIITPQKESPKGQAMPVRTPPDQMRTKQNDTNSSGGSKGKDTKGK